ncbi:hypothetical protein [Streptomyces sp. NPDC046161]
MTASCGSCPRVRPGGTNASSSTHWRPSPRTSAIDCFAARRN